ncbi:TPA: Na+/H+ antiporter family protein [Photobacterium damselae]|uniref:H+/gluconate symporter and related permeases n=4 Tax=Photobacterium damselae TaxID=38293 RepID=A0A2T3QJA5_PHODM|nr:Na+/H+ antiporter family protein [Photobacterium damselae]AWK81409.1 sodium:proton antiporter [Photobacterium damselae]EEZ40581.1 putative permease [Photobacterium damselae subsp. damselae CIP 102761]EHA1081199.1 Na+/H+ antiporter family protein [Photobacterium damselae]EJN6959922.1 Na+/H+ antiporter family protein [Photobacterium damselae]ELI6448007.1 Na+/H+ antiporter family protein [Photobacterium damselae]
MNPVVIAVCVMLVLALLRVNVVVALTFSAIVGGLIGGLSLTDAVTAFQNGLGGGATTALSYAMLGTFAVAISHSGITDVLAQKVIKRISGHENAAAATGVKYSVLTILLLLAISSQNAIPVHIAFIPIVIPPLLHVFAKLKLDRRLIACVLTFGLVTPYMVLPIGFGGIFLNNILLKNLHDNGLDVAANQVPIAMLLPAMGMVTGLLIAVFFSYRKPREYSEAKILANEPEHKTINMKHVYVAIAAILAALGAQIYSSSMIIGGLVGFMVFTVTGVIKYKETHDVFTKGVHMMAMIGFIMIAAAGFASVMKATGGVESLVNSLEAIIGNNKPLASLLMLVVGLLVTMGIGSSFSTIPILATIYVPLCLSFGFSPMATIAIVGTAAALGDAGSPASDSTLGPTSGLNADGQHEHIWETVVPTFIHYNLPLIAAGWIASMIL